MRWYWYIKVQLIYDKRNQLLFKSGLHSPVSEEEKRCLCLRRLSAGSAGLAGDVKSAYLILPGWEGNPRCQLVQGIQRQ